MYVWKNIPTRIYNSIREKKETVILETLALKLYLSNKNKSQNEIQLSREIISEYIAFFLSLFSRED